MSAEHFDVLIVGAGISGIGAGYHLQRRCPTKTYAILEGRSSIGGTWDLFRYPGIRSDSDMFTLGYSFQPWKEARSIVAGPSILRYLQETARKFGVDRKICFQQRVISAAWSSEDSRWTIEVEAGEDKRLLRYTCGFLYLCSGYYDYKTGHAPDFPGREQFHGLVIHPQHWPKDFDYREKRIVVIGSGATAVTLVPALAQTASHVTMLQRSPTYVVGLPSVDSLAKVALKVLPKPAAIGLVRWKNVLLGMFFYQLCRHAPGVVKWLFRRHHSKELPPDFDIDPHLKPKYEPWDQRVCVVPDSDLFQAIKAGRVSIVTDEIATFTEHGILLKSGNELPADVIITATGLKLLACGGIQLSVDGAPIRIGECLAYKGLMLSGVPNLAICVGYTTASWTLRADLTSMYVCRLLNYLDRHGYQQCVPEVSSAGPEQYPLLGLNSGYVRRSIGDFPKQGSRSPWRLRQNYILDFATMKFGAIDDGTLKFAKGKTQIHAPALDRRPADCQAPTYEITG